MIRRGGESRRYRTAVRFGHWMMLSSLRDGNLTFVRGLEIRDLFLFFADVFRVAFPKAFDNPLRSLFSSLEDLS